MLAQSFFVVKDFYLIPETVPSGQGGTLGFRHARHGKSCTTAGWGSIAVFRTEAAYRIGYKSRFLIKLAHGCLQLSFAGFSMSLWEAPGFTFLLIQKQIFLAVIVEFVYDEAAAFFNIILRHGVLR